MLLFVWQKYLFFLNIVLLTEILGNFIEILQYVRLNLAQIAVEILLLFNKKAKDCNEKLEKASEKFNANS
jgi:hypothetical protein